jgi:cytochrome c biogenesis protein
MDDKTPKDGSGGNGSTLNSLVDRTWKFFASVKLAIVVFAFIGITSIAGTILEQNAAPQKNIQILSKFVGESLAPSAYRALEAAGFMDMYNSWWFVVLLMLFASNLLICSVDRFPRIWRLMREPLKPLKPEAFRSFPIRRETRLSGKLNEAKEQAVAALGAIGFKKFEEQEQEGAWQFYAQKNRYGRSGVYVTHISILLIMVGAVIGGIFGFKGYLNLPEGNAYAVAFKSVPYLTPEEGRERNLVVDVVQSQAGDVSAAAGQLGVSPDHLRSRMKRLGVEPLGFTVRCEDFDVEFYGNSDMAKEYTSNLTVFDGGREVVNKWIEVNDPLEYKGYMFYQSSYGPMGTPDAYTYVVRSTSASGRSETLRVGLGEEFTIPGTEIRITVTDFSPALSFDQSGRAFTYTEMMNNPAARITVKEGDRENSKWILKRYPSTWTVAGSSQVQLVDVWGAQYTGLQVRKDPGVWVVYLGCFLMSVGLYVAFFMSHRKIWIRLVREKGGTLMQVAATTHRGRESYEQKIDNMVSRLQAGGK